MAITSTSISDEAPAARANFVRVYLTAPDGAAAQVIWRPYAGAVGVDFGARQRRLMAASQWRSNPDSLRRWNDPTVRDTVPLRVPASLLVDMTGGPFLIEATGRDSILVKVERVAPFKHPEVARWGHRLEIRSESIPPSIVRHQ